MKEESEMSPTGAPDLPGPERVARLSAEGETPEKAGALTELERQDLGFREDSGWNTQDRLLQWRQLCKERALNLQKACP